MISKRPLALVVITAVLALSCGSESSVVSSPEFVELEMTLESLRADAVASEEALQRAQESVAAEEAALRDLEELRDELNREGEQLQLELDALQAELDSLGAERREPVPAVDALKEEEGRLQTEIEAFKSESTEYRAYLLEQLALADTFDCATTVAERLRTLEMDDIGPVDFAEFGIVEPELAADVLRRDVRLLNNLGSSEASELAYPDGCPTWWLDQEPNFATTDRLLDHVCPTVEPGQITKDPERYDGQCFVGWGHIVQYDSATGPCTFHINIGDRDVATYQYGFRAEFTVDRDSCEFLDSLVQGDEIQWKGVVTGLVRYETRIGGTNTIPQFAIFSWTTYR